MYSLHDDDHEDEWRVSDAFHTSPTTTFEWIMVPLYTTVLNVFYALIGNVEMLFFWQLQLLCSMANSIPIPMADVMFDEMDHADHTDELYCDDFDYTNHGIIDVCAHHMKSYVTMLPMMTRDLDAGEMDTDDGDKTDSSDDAMDIDVDSDCDEASTMDVDETDSSDDAMDIDVNSDCDEASMMDVDETDSSDDAMDIDIDSDCEETSMMDVDSVNVNADFASTIDDNDEMDCDILAGEHNHILYFYTCYHQTW